MQDGRLIHPASDMNDFTSELQEAIKTNTVVDYFVKLQASKPDHIVRLQDFFSIKLDKTLQNMPIAFTRSSHLPGGWYDRRGLIHLVFDTGVNDNSNFNILLHEMIHAVVDTNIIDQRYEYLPGSSDGIANLLKWADTLFTKKSQTDDLTEYLRTNFPLTFKLFGDSDKYNKLGKVIYILLYEEQLARSIGHFDMLVYTGFTYKFVGNSVFLVSPDGKRQWRVSTMSPIMPST